MIRWSVWLGSFFLLTSCLQRVHFQRQLRANEEKFKDNVGFVLYDPVSRKTLISYRAANYFTPASNTKIFTFYTATQLLRDSVPALSYAIRHDSLILWGTGDPSFLYPQVYNDNRVYDFLKNAPQNLYFSSSNFQTEHLGPGWAWDDYYYNFSSERSPFPIFGNLAAFDLRADGRWVVTPPVFSVGLSQADSVDEETTVVREINSNRFTIYPGRKASANRSWQVPFHCSPDVFVKLLSDTLKREVRAVDIPLARQRQQLRGIPGDSLYRVMMQDSDNFLAEQILLMCAGVVSDTLSPEIAIRYSTKNFLFDLPDKPVWIDGSGLSRYNLFTPRSIVRLWEKIYLAIPRERLFKLIAVGGQNGTIRNWYKNDIPYIFGKSGYLSNHQTMSGYLISQKGKVLIFSFMNSDFVVPSSDIRKAMQEFLAEIREKY